jgi:hypothetical protein
MKRAATYTLLFRNHESPEWPTRSGIQYAKGREGISDAKFSAPLLHQPKVHRSIARLSFRRNLHDASHEISRPRGVLGSGSSVRELTKPVRAAGSASHFDAAIV